MQLQRHSILRGLDQSPIHAGFPTILASVLISCAASAKPVDPLLLPSVGGGLTAPWSITSIKHVDSLARAVDAVTAKSDNPARARRLLLMEMRASNMCYAPDISQDEFERLVAASGLRPASLLGGPENRFELSSTVWTGDGLQGPKGQAARARLTYSFPPDGTIWGTDAAFFVGVNLLNAQLISGFGFRDAGREWIRQSLASWRRIAGIDYDEVGDDGRAMDTTAARRSAVGDVRIGGYVFSQTNGGTDLAGVLAYNNFPTSGGDMALDLSEFTATRFLRPDNSYRYFRNTVAHEHGHGLGFIHQVPCNQTKLMEPSLSTSYDATQVDDRRGAGSSYGDRYAGNSSIATAFDLGTFGPTQVARAEQDLSINGQNGPNGSGEDWFKFTVTSTVSFQIALSPTGGTYTTGSQMSTPTDACAGATASIESSRAGDLDVQLYGTDGTTLLAQSTNGSGVNESITHTLNPGTYYIRVFDFGPNLPDKVQLYTLIAGYSANFNPVACAGINKRIDVNEFCQFMGDINSLGGLLPINSFQWDLNGDGTIDVVDPRPVTSYGVPGTRTVTLFLLDSAGHYATDSIKVTVIGPGPTFGSLSTTSASQGATVPVTINGSNLGSPTVTVSGTGVSVIGTPSVNLSSANSPITGLSFAVDVGATPGLRNVTITTPSGTTTATNAFEVIAGVATISSITPSSGIQGQSYPLTINGSNFNPALSVSIDGTGVSITGTPAVNAARTQITGLTIVINQSAPTTVRSLRVATPPNGNPTTPFTVLPPAIANDFCTSATTINVGQTLQGSTANATTDGSVPSGCTIGSSKDVYYSFTPPCSGTYTFQTSPATLDTVLSVHTGCPATAANSIACNDDVVPGGPDLNSRLSVALNGGVSYIVRVAAYSNGPGGTFTLEATPTPPANDNCATAGALPIGATNFDSCTASSESVGTISCQSGVSDLWFTFTSPVSGRTTIDTCGSSYDTVVEVTPAPCGSGSIFPLGCNDDGCGTASRVVFTAAAGNAYLVRVQKRFVILQPAYGGPGTITRYCPSDINLSGLTTVQDIFDFITAYFANSPTADFNGSGAVTVQDIFDFVAAYFVSC